jgi:hypothetical protein
LREEDLKASVRPGSNPFWGQFLIYATRGLVAAMELRIGTFRIILLGRTLTVMTAESLNSTIPVTLNLSQLGGVRVPCITSLIDE